MRVGMSTRSSHVTNRHGIVGQPSYVSSSFSQVTGISRVVHNAFKRISMNDTRCDEYRRYDKEELQPGTIIRAPLHEENFNRTKRSELSSMSSAKSSHISFSDRCGVRVIYSESRLLIVVAAFSRHFLPITLYTYASTGLKYKDDVGEYASIQDHRQPSSLEEAAYLFTTAELKEGVGVFPQCLSGTEA